MESREEVHTLTDKGPINHKGCVKPYLCYSVRTVAIKYDTINTNHSSEEKSFHSVIVIESFTTMSSALWIQFEDMLNFM